MTKKNTYYRALLRKMTYKDKTSYDSTPPCRVFHACPEFSTHCISWQIYKEFCYHYTYIYVYVYTYIYVYMYIYIYVCMYIHVCIYICVYTYIFFWSYASLGTLLRWLRCISTIHCNSLQLAAFAQAAVVWAHYCNK